MADNVASILNDLIETSKDGEKGFNTAADDTKNSQLGTTFRRRAQDCAQERRRFAEPRRPARGKA